MRIKLLIGVFFVILLLALFYQFQKHIEEKTLFPKEEIIHTNIEQIQILIISSNDNKVIDEMDNIEMLSSYLREINTDKIHNDVSGDDEQPVYHIYIVNIGRHANPTISVYKDSIVYQGKKLNMGPKEASSLFQLIEEIHE